MAAEKVLVTKSKLDNLAEIISSKTEEPIPLTIDEMGAAVLDLTLVNNQNKTVTPTMEDQVIAPDANYTGLGEVTVKAMSIEPLTVSPSTSTQVFNNSGVDGYSPVTVKAAAIYTEPVTIKPEGPYGANAYAYNIPVFDATGRKAITFDTGTTTIELSGNIVEGTPLTIGYGYVYPGGRFYDEELTWSNGQAVHNNRSTKFTLTISPSTDNNPATATIVVMDGVQWVDLDVRASFLGMESAKIPEEPNLLSENIKKDVSIYGTIGTYTPNIRELTVTPSAETQVFTGTSTVASLNNVTAYVRGKTATTSVDLSALTIGETYHITGTGTYLLAGTSASYATLTFDADWTATVGSTIPFTTSKPAQAERISSITFTSSSVLTTAFTTKGENEAHYTIDFQSKADGYSPVTVNGDADLLPENIKKDVDIFGVVGTYEGSGGGSTINNQDKTVTPTKSQQSITADSGYTGLGTVTVNAIPSEYIIPTGELSVTSNGTSDVTNYASVSVNVQPTLQSKSVTPTESAQTVTPDTGYDGLSQVSVEAISSTYVGSDIPRKSSSGISVTAPTFVQDGSSDLLDYSATVSKGYYQANYTSGNRVNMTNIDGLPTRSAITITPTKESQTAVQARRWLTGDITVAPIPNEYVIPTLQSKSISPTVSQQSVRADTGYTGLEAVTVEAIPVITDSDLSITIGNNSFYTENGVRKYKETPSVTGTKAGYMYFNNGSTKNGTDKIYSAIASGTTVTPTKSSQSIGSSFTMMEGPITVNAIPAQYITTTDATATAADILNGKTAYVNGSKVTGTLSFITCYTGTSDPSSSLGKDGDVYLKVAS